MDLKKIYENYFSDTTKVSIDTRTVGKGDIFIALKGDRFDGNKFASKAIELGAKLAIVDNPEYHLDSQTVLVNDSLEFLQKFANYHRSQFDIPVIGITGTNGKTTTKELVNACLEKKYNTIFTQGNYNNHIGVPLTLFQINSSTEIAIVEMGANHLGEIAQLSEIAMPNYGLITSIGKAHLEGFGSIDNILKTKRELFDYIVKNNHTFFSNLDDHRVNKLSSEYEKSITYSTKTETKLISANPCLRILFEKENFQLQTNMFGEFNYSNIMAAYVVAKEFGLDSDLIFSALADYTPSNIRSQVISTSANKLIVDAYNANPTSMSVAIDSFLNVESDNKLAILGTMAELGADSEQEHYDLVARIRNSDLNTIFVGKIFRQLANLPETSVIFDTTDDLIEFLNRNAIKDRTILIKGSRSNQLDKIIEFL